MALHKKIFLDNNKICVVRTDKIGDMVLTLPLIRAIKENFPEKETIIIAKKVTKAIIQSNKYIDKFYFIEDFNNIKEIFNLENIKVAFFPRPNSKEVFAAFISGVTLRVGIAFRWYSLLFNFKINHHRSLADKNEAEYNVEMLSLLLDTDYQTKLTYIDFSKDNLERIKAISEKLNFKITDEYIILHPGSGGSSKDWNVNKFSQLSERISKNGYKVVVTGSEVEIELCNSIVQSNPDVVNFAGLLNLDDLIALISNSKALVANSTGILHIAAANDIPVLGLYPNSPNLSANRWGPFTKKRKIVSPPKSDNKAERDDMSLISVDSVFGELMELLSE